jgi:uncharacterized damage-inducible protein DinB
MSPANEQLVQNYAAGEKRVADAVVGWSEADLRRVPDEALGADVGRWSVHQLLIHLQDAELAFADRLRRVIAMPESTLLAWDENHFTQRLHYSDQFADDAVQLIRLTRRQMARVLAKLEDADFEKTGIHSVRGPQKLGAIIGFADWHLNHHLSFIEKKRAAFKN